MEVVVIKRGVIDTYSRRKSFSKFTSWVITITGTIILAVAALSYYGIQVGSFVISMNHAQGARSIWLSTEEDLSNPTSRISAPPLKNAWDTQYQTIPENIEEGLGSKNGYSDEHEDFQTYFAFSFYIFNGGNESVDYNMNFAIRQNQGGLDKIVRILIIQDGVKTFYAKARDDGSNETVCNASGQELFQATPFESEDTIVDINYLDFDVGAKTKYTIVFWLDGWDKDQSKDMLGGALKLSLTYTVIG